MSRILKVSGERQIGNNKWRRFSKEFTVPSSCDTKGITAKFEGGILYLRQPKLITSSPARAPKTAATSPSAAGATAAAASAPRPDAQAAASSPSAQSTVPKAAPEQQKQSALPHVDTQQKQTRLNEAEKDLEEKKTEKMHKEKDEISKEKSEVVSKDEERQTMCQLTPRPRQMVGRRGFFEELRKPENCKRLVVSVLLVLGVGFYVNYMFNSFLEDDKEL